MTPRSDGPPVKVDASPRRRLDTRVGVAWDISGEGTRVVRAGFGLFFDGVQQINHFARVLQAEADAREPRQ